MPQQRKGDATVFIGNINYDATEDQLKDIFSQVGTVVNIRVVYDNDTGRPKGYGFCEYEDAETAMSARRNLNGVELNGRQLRVDFTESDKPSQSGSGGARSGGPGNGVGGGGVSGGGPTLPEALNGPNPSLAMLSLPQLHEVMLQLKRAVSEHPAETRDLFMKNPQLAHAVLQGQILLGMVPLPPPMPQMPGNTPGQIGPGAGMAPPPPPPGIQPGAMMPPGPGTHIGAPGTAPSALGSLPSRIGPSMASGMASGMPGMPPPMPGPPQPQVVFAEGHGGTFHRPVSAVQLDPSAVEPLMDQATLLKQVCEMAPHAIEQLPPDQREQVLQLQQLALQQRPGMVNPPGLGTSSGPAGLPPQGGPRGPFM